MSGTIYLKAGVELKLEAGAAILANPDLASYGHYITDKDMSKYDTGVGTANQNCVSDTIWSQALVIAYRADGASLPGPEELTAAALSILLAKRKCAAAHCACR